MKIITPSNSKFPLIILALIGSMIVTLGAYFYYQYEKQILKTEKHAELSAISQLKTDQIVKWQEERLSESVFFTKNYPFSKYTLGIIEGNDEYKDLLRDALSYIMTNNRYENIYLLSTSGKLLFSVIPDTIPTNPITISKVDTVIKTGKVESTDFYYSNPHKSVNLEYLAPLFSNNKVAGILVFSVNPDKYIFPIIENWPTPSKTAETLIVSRDGDSVTFLNHLRHVENKNFSLKLPLTRTDVSAVSAVHGNVGIFEGYDYRGKKVLSDIKKIPDSNWYIISKVDKDEVYQDLYIRTALILIITIVSFILLGFIIAWSYSRRQRDVFKELYSKKVELHESQELYKATLYSIGDGVITTDKNGIVKQLNPVAENLTGWKECEARGKALEEVFNIINEETRLKVESPVSRVLKSGLIVGLANHTLLISKDGSEIPIADSGASIKNAKGVIAGVVMVFRDQTEERKHQNGIKESEEHLSALISQMQLGMAVHEMIFSANGEPVDYRFLDVNPAFEKLTGLNKDDILGKTILEVLPNTEPVWIERYGKVIQTGEPLVFENYAAELGKYFSVMAYKSQVNQFAVLVEDITQRKKEEAELIEREVQYRNLANSSIALIWTSGVDKLCNYFNETWLKFTGRTFEQEQGNGWAEGVHPDDFDRCLETYVTAFDKHEPFEMEYRLRHVSGEYKILLDLGTPNYNSKGEFSGYIGHCFDITERKLLEESIRKSEKQFRQLVDNAPQGIFVQTNKRFAYLNPVAVKLFGAKSQDELVGELVIERYNPDYRELVKQRIEKLNNEQKEVPSIEEVCLKMDETPFHVEVSAVPLNYQGVNGALVFFQDITQRKKADNELIELKNELEQKVIEKTKELNERIAELERFREATINRELRIKELRDELERLKG